MPADALLRLALTATLAAGLLLACPPGRAAVEPRAAAPASELAADGSDDGTAVIAVSTPSRDAAPIRVAAAASAGLAAHGLPAGAGETAPSTDPPAALLVIAAVLVIVFVTTRRQKDR
mgnify:CR=1 FL=1